MSLLKSRKNTVVAKGNTPTSVTEILEKTIKDEDYQKVLLSNEDRLSYAIFSTDYSDKVAILNNQLSQIDTAIKGLNATVKAVKKVEKTRELDPNIKTR